MFRGSRLLAQRASPLVLLAEAGRGLLTCPHQCFLHCRHVLDMDISLEVKNAHLPHPAGPTGYISERQERLMVKNIHRGGAWLRYVQ